MFINSQPPMDKGFSIIKNLEKNYHMNNFWLHVMDCKIMLQI